MGRRRHTTGSARHHDDGGVANAPPLGSERHHTSTEVYDIDGSTKGTSPHHHVALPVHKDTSGSWKVLYAVGGWMVSHFQKRRNKSSRKKSRNHGEDSKEFRAMVMVAFVVALMAVLLGGRNGTVGETPMHPALGPMGFDPKEAENRENYLNRFAVVHDAKTGSLYISPNKGTKKELYMNKILTEIGEHGVALTMITKHLVPCTIYNGTNSGLEKWMDRYPVLGGDRDPTGVLRNAMQYVSDEMCVTFILSDHILVVYCYFSFCISENLTVQSARDMNCGFALINAGTCCHCQWTSGILGRCIRREEEGKKLFWQLL